MCLLSIETGPVGYAMLLAGGVLFVVYLVITWRRAQERRRRWNGELCPECGYDVRMNAVKCPECGTPIRRFPRDNSAMVIPDDRR